MTRRIATLPAVVAIVLLAGCSTEREPTMTPIEARDAVIALMTETVAQAQSTGWVVQPVNPGYCTIDGQPGVAFSASAYTQVLGADAATDAQRVAEFWEAAGLGVRIVPEPTPVVFGSGGSVSAASFATLPTYAVSVTAECVPGEPSDYNDLPNPTLPAAEATP